MKTFFKNLKGGLTFGLGIGIMLFICGIVYASLNNVEEGDILTSEKWNELIGTMNTFSGALDGGLASPTGAIIAFNRDTCPSGWLPADGTNGTIDLRGVFIRGANSFDNGITYNNRDEDRADAGSGTLTYQDDQMRAITGSTNRLLTASVYVSGGGGALYSGNSTSTAHLAGGSAQGYTTIGLNSSRLGENYDGKDTHPKNIALIYCVKA